MPGINYAEVESEGFLLVPAAAAGSTLQELETLFSDLSIFPSDPLFMAAGCCQSAPPGSRDTGAPLAHCPKLSAVHLMGPEVWVYPWRMRAEVCRMKASGKKMVKRAAVWLNPWTMRAKGRSQGTSQISDWERLLARSNVDHKNSLKFCSVFLQGGDGFTRRHLQNLKKMPYEEGEGFPTQYPSGSATLKRFLFLSSADPPVQKYDRL